ncbi:hypothetical protein Rs2_42105 [Raphanus sativus]|nr:hypothetical protein Rs2_42105 [Raphanus sativus]
MGLLREFCIWALHLVSVTGPRRGASSNPSSLLSSDDGAWQINFSVETGLFVPSMGDDKKISLWRKDGNSLAVPVAVKNDGDSEVNSFLDYFIHAMKNQRPSVGGKLNLLVESEFSAERTVEVRTRVEPFVPLYKSLGGECRTTHVPSSEIRPLPPPFGSRCFGLLENVDAHLERIVSKCGESASQTPRSMPNSVVETPKTKETAMVLPFVKKSPCWKVFESMEILKAVEQRPHFSHSVYISVHC